jgi:hypothetical protein
MSFDLRLPIGIMFSLFGAMLTIFGFATRGSEIYQHSLGVNVNLRWGLVLLLFGVFMLFLAMKGRKSSGNNQPPPAGKPGDKPPTPPC